MIEILQMLGLTILQNASFTLVSRARNSNSLMYHTIASALSNGIWLLVIRNVVANFDNLTLMITYLIGYVIGSISMHYVAMKYFEKVIKRDSTRANLYMELGNGFYRDKKYTEAIKWYEAKTKSDSSQVTGRATMRFMVHNQSVQPSCWHKW
jgi:uncharacterized protein YebE (UPF0316 family)